MTACTAIMECRHKIAFVSTLPIEKLLPWFPVCAFHFFPLFPFEFWFILLSFFLFFYFLLSFRAECWLQPPTDDCNLYSWGPLDPQTGGKKKLQAVNELPSFPSVKGVYKLDPFVRALLCSISLAPPLPPLAATFSPHPCALPSITPFLLLFNFLSLPACFTLQ